MEFAECGSLYKVLHQLKPQVPYHSGHAIRFQIYEILLFRIILSNIC